MKGYWTVGNTIFKSWFERDRAYVSLESDLGGEIIVLWDSQVLEFVEDGFKSDSEHWHISLVNYANEMGLIAK